MLLARALWTVGRRADALAAAVQAQIDFAGDADGVRPLAELRTWLAAHGQHAGRRERAARVDPPVR